MPISISTFGQFQGNAISLFTLKNANGMQVKITTYGATITSISVPGNGRRVELAAGFDHLDGYFDAAYVNNAPYFGCTVGRYASRIKDGKFSIDGRDFQVDVNDGSNHLHGGIGAFDKRIWEARLVTETSIALSLFSPDGDGGYPGNLTVRVTFTLTDDNELIMDYHGTTDQATPLSLTNHTYFNLSGFDETIHNHEVQVAADTFLQPDPTNVPVGEERMVDHDFTDLRIPSRLGAQLDQTATGYETYYKFDGSTQTPRAVAHFVHPQSGRELYVLTTEPGALFYTGYFTSDELSRSNGDRYGKYRAFCFETSRYPNGPNLPGVTDAVLQPGEMYTSRTIYQINF